MSSKELQFLFEDLIGQQLQSKGFEVVKNDMRDKYYRRHTEHGYERIVFIFAHYGRILTIQPFIALHFDQIVEIYKKNTQYQSRPNKCIGNHLLEIERFVKNGESTERVYVNHHWEVRNKDHITELVNRFGQYFKTVIKPYFDQNSTIAHVDALLNEQPTVPSIHNNLNPLRACIAIIAARLNSNPKFDELLSIYDETIKKGAESYQADYQKIREYLLAGS